MWTTFIVKNSREALTLLWVLPLGAQIDCHSEYWREVFSCFWKKAGWKTILKQPEHSILKEVYPYTYTKWIWKKEKSITNLIERYSMKKITKEYLNFELHESIYEINNILKV